MVYSIEKTRVGALDATDSIFDHFRKLYPKFDHWLLQVSHRDAYVVKDGEHIVALMILKRESSYGVNSEIQPMIPKKNHLKICSLCSIREGEGLGSLLLHKAIEVATADHLPYVYLTLHKSNQNKLTQLFFEKRGFEECGSTNDEVVYMKTISAIESEPIEVLGEADAKAVKSENESKVNWRRFWRGVGKLSLEVFLVMWLIIFFNLGRKFDCALLGFLSTYLGLVPIHVFLWEGITQKLNKKSASKE